MAVSYSCCFYESILLSCITYGFLPIYYIEGDQTPGKLPQL